jgi:lysophospholipase L1-like esterase
LMNVRNLPRVGILCALLCALASISLSQNQSNWVGSWGTSQQLVEPQNSIPLPDIRDATLRQIVHLSIGGSTIRLRLSNRFGATPLHLTSVHIARSISPASSKIVPESDTAVRFSGTGDTTIPPGAEYLSDPLLFQLAPLSDLAITLHTDVPPIDETGHPGARASSYFLHGDFVSATDLPNAKTVEHWYYIAGIDVLAPETASAIVVLGDSVTDGHGVTTNGNDRWTDVLAKRLQGSAETRSLSVLNEGIGGNHLLTDGLGQNALARFDHDVIAQPGVRYLIVFEGINDVGLLAREGADTPAEHHMLVQRMMAAYEQVIARAHTHNIKVIGGTLTPFSGSEYYHPAASNEADRQAVNDWIRAPGHFDAVIDFDKITRDAQHPDRFLPQFDGGDHLHPSVAGYAAMGEAVPLSLFALVMPSIPTQR